MRQRPRRRRASPRAIRPELARGQRFADQVIGELRHVPQPSPARHPCPPDERVRPDPIGVEAPHQLAHIHLDGLVIGHVDEPSHRAPPALCRRPQRVRARALRGQHPTAAAAFTFLNQNPRAAPATSPDLAALQCCIVDLVTPETTFAGDTHGTLTTSTTRAPITASPGLPAAARKV